MAGKQNTTIPPDQDSAVLLDTVFSRVDGEGHKMAELRCNIKRITMDVIDAEAMAETKEHKKTGGKEVSRSEVVNRILDQWAREKIDNARLIVQLADINPTALAELNRRRRGEGNG